MRKILFFDIDGTVMNHGYIPDSCKEAISKAQNNGHLCFINTGRPYSTVPLMIKNLGFDGFVCGCGTYVEMHQKVLYAFKLEKEIRKKVQTLLFQYPIDIILEGTKQTCFINRINSDEFLKCYQEFSSHFDLHEYKENELLDFEKMTLFFNEGTDIHKLRKELSEYFDIIDRESTFIEVIPLHHSKATGIERVLEACHASKKETISFGDGPNDLPMLKYTEESVAMGNSKKEILPFVTYVTDTIENDGIYKAMEHYHLI